MRTVGARGFVLTTRGRILVTGRQREAFIRLLIVCAAWALGEALEYQFDASALGPVLPIILAVAAYLATRDISMGGGSGDESYWRGRRIDRDRWH